MPTVESKQRSVRGTSFLKGSLLLFLVLLNNIIFIPSFLAIMLFLWPLRLVHSQWYWGIESFLMRHLCMAVSLWILLCKIEVYQEGEDLINYMEEPCLVLVNHQSTADVPILIHLVNALPGCFYKVMWVLDKMFKWTPFGLICQLHGDLFIREGKQSQQQYGLDDLSKQLKRKFWPRHRRWIVVFPEGGFLYKRLESSQNYARKHGFPLFEHVLLPRTGAVQTVIDICTAGVDNVKQKCSTYFMGQPQSLRHVLDLTIAYENGEAFSLWNICTGTVKAKVVLVRCRRYEICDHSKEAVFSYLCDLWSEKEKWLKKCLAVTAGEQTKGEMKNAARKSLIVPMECVLFSQGVMWLFSLTCYIALRLLNLRMLLAAGFTFWVLRKIHYVFMQHS